jgi:hypothetical protein
MKSYLSSVDIFNSTLKPSDDKEKYDQTIKPFLPFTNQKDFSKYLFNCQFEETGNISTFEIDIINTIKEELGKINKDNKGISIDRLEFDYAITIHRNLKKIGWGRYLLDDIGMWRYLSLNFFKEEVFIRRGKQYFDKGDYLRAAKATFDHSFGPRIRDIFPRRYFIIGDRLFDKIKRYNLLEQLSGVSKSEKEGGFGNLIANLIETSLLSPHDHVSKIMSKVLFLSDRPANDKEVAKSFVRYNGFKSRLLNNAHEALFKDEICLRNT